MKLLRNFTVPCLVFLGTAGLLACGSPSPSLLAQSPGERVVVTAPFETKLGDKKVDAVYSGDIHLVLAVDGKWVALEGVRGWVARQNVMSLPSARKFYEQRIKRNVRDYDAIASLGMIQYEQGDYTAAFTQLNEAIKLNKNNPAVWNWRGIVLNAQQKYNAAIVDFTEALRINPKFAYAFHNRGLTRFEMGEFTEAIKDFDEAIKLEENKAEFHTHRGAAWHAAGDEAKALADFDKALSLSKRTVDAWLGKGNVYLGKNDYQAALENAAKALELEPKNAKALNLRGWVAYKQQRFPEARQDLDAAIQLAPDFPVPLNNRGVLSVDEKKYDAAIADFGKALELAPDTAIYLTNRGNAHYGKGNYAAALADYQKAVELTPDLTDALNGLAWFLATCPDEQSRNGARAVELAEKLVALTKTEDWSYLDTLAASLAATGKFEEAVARQTKAAELAPAEKRPICQERLERYRQRKAYVEGGPK
ncbi:MAG: tetratricopeptide repeat protein [Planctomycetota bacterium]